VGDNSFNFFKRVKVIPSEIATAAYRAIGLVTTTTSFPLFSSHPSNELPNPTRLLNHPGIFNGWSISSKIARNGCFAFTPVFSLKALTFHIPFQS
jgi:predicted short-subunit dehydrogenase-like oxidoreductase (DUF2520 family)